MDTDTWNARRVLGLLSPEMRQQAAEALFTSECLPPEAREATTSTLIRIMKWRPVAFKRLPRAKKAGHLLRHLDHQDMAAIRWAVVACYLDAHGNGVMDDFGDYWGFRHRPWMLGVPVPPPPGPEQVRQALDQYRGKHEPVHVAAYLALTGNSDPAWREALWPHIDAVLAASAGAGGAPPASPKSPAVFIEAGFAPVPEELNALDVLLVQTAAAVDADSAAQPGGGAVAAGVQALIDLDPQRPASWFAYGFVRELGLQAAAEPAGEEQTGWHLAGRLAALSRRNAWRSVVALADAQREGVERLVSSQAGCAPPCAGVLFRSFWTVGRRREAVAFAEPCLLVPGSAALAHGVADFAEDRISSHAPAEAGLLLDAVAEAQKRLGQAASSRDFEEHVALLRARCLCGEGRFDQSRALLEPLLRGNPIRRFEVHCELGLVAGEFSWLSDVRLPDSREQADAVAARLQRGRDHFTASKVPNTGQLPTEAAYPLGVLALLEEAPDAADILERACADTADREERFRADRLLARMHAYCGLAQLLTLDESRIPGALEHLRLAEAAYPVEEWPAWLLVDASQIIDVADTPESVELLEWLHLRAPAATEPHLRDPRQLLRSEALRQQLARRAADTSARGPEDLWRDNEALLAAHLEANEPDAARAVLDRLEQLALRYEGLRDRYLALLDRPEAHGPAWDEDDALQSAALVCAAAGRAERAYVFLRRLFFLARDREQWEQAAHLLERIQALDLPDALVDEVVRQQPAVAAQVPAAEDDTLWRARELLQDGRPLRLLVVGGDEAEARFVDDVRSHLADKAPGLVIDFEHTPRVDAWRKYYDRISGRLDTYDGLVMMPWMRTDLGRSLRALASQRKKPWFPCAGGGRSHLERTLYDAACRLVRPRKG